MTDRERLVEVMARATWRALHRDMPWDSQLGWVQQDFRAAAIAALAAAERAGFEFRKKEVSDG